MNKIDEILDILKNNVVKKEEKKTCPFVWILAIIGAVVAVGAIGYAVYRYFSAEELDDFDDDFDEDFDDDFFEDEDTEQIVIPKQEAVEPQASEEESKEEVPTMTVEEQ